MQDTQCRSETAVGATELKNPAAQGELTASHKLLPVATLNVPAAQAVHVRSLDSVAALFM